jgi:hypothetical protein
MSTQPPLTGTDIGWFVILTLVLLALVVGSMLIFVAGVGPHIPGFDQEMPVAGLRTIDKLMLFVGVIVGAAVSLVSTALLARRYASASTKDRWTLQFQHGRAQMPTLQRTLAEKWLNCVRGDGNGNAL